MPELDAGALDRLSGALGGGVHLPGSPEYEESREIWNGDIDRRPAVVARCGTADEVAAAIAFGIEAGLDITVRGGGHGFSGHAVADGALMIHLTGFKDVHVDPDARIAYVGGGCQWAEVDAATAEHGLAVTAGVVSHTGVAGLALGGGIGYLMNKFGLTCDNIVGAEVVTAAGEVVHASADEHSELFWALRGGGGNFGIVTQFEFQLHPLAGDAELGLLFWPLDQGADALRACREAIRTLPEDMAFNLFGLDAPEADFVPEMYQGKPGYMIMVISFEGEAQLQSVLDPIRAAVAPAFEMLTPVPYPALQQMFDANNPWGTHGYEKALYFEEISDEAIEIFNKYMVTKQGFLTNIYGVVFTGAYAAADENDCAFGGPRKKMIQINLSAICRDAEELAADRPWVRGFWDELLPMADNSGSYVNYMPDVQEDRLRAAYGTEKYERLARIKAEYDPQNVFHHNQNIKPAPAAKEAV
ncbi:MAG TPA: FAD-binding oxidoreductase [Solirubrobacterales bacterium]|nr:FAD-binding oxidoreductase [Solirubrobacterales bacterium]